MRIAFLSDDFPPESFGGAGISTYELAVGMQQAGHDVFVITTCRTERDAGETDYQGLKVLRLYSNYHERWRAYRSLYNPPVVQQVSKLLKDIRPDVVHANNVHYHLSYHVLKLAKQEARAVVFTARDVMAFNYGKLVTDRYLEHFDCYTTWIDHITQAKKRWNPFRNVFIKRYLGYVDKLCAVSVALKRALEQNGIKNVEVIHSGADVETWHVPSAGVSQFRKQHGLLDKKVILFGGRLSGAKGGRVTLKAMVEIAKEIPNAALMIVGKYDRYTAHMKAEAQKLGIDDKLVFMGWVERDTMKLVVASCDIVLVPSVCFDAFPRAVLEASAAGKPVVGTCYGGAPELVIDGVTGYVVNPRQPREVANRTIDLLKDPEKAKSFGTAGQDQVGRNFNLKEKVREYEIVYKTLLGKKKIK